MRKLGLGLAKRRRRYLMQDDGGEGPPYETSEPWDGGEANGGDQPDDGGEGPPYGDPESWDGGEAYGGDGAGYDPDAYGRGREQLPPDPAWDEKKMESYRRGYTDGGEGEDIPGGYADGSPGWSDEGGEGEQIKRRRRRMRPIGTRL